MKVISRAITFQRIALVAACGAGLATLPAAGAAAYSPDSWREFARRSMMPDYGWNDAPSAEALVPSLRDRALNARNASLTLSLSDVNTSAQRALTLSVSNQPESLGVNEPVLQTVDLQRQFSPLRNQAFGTTYEQAIGLNSQLGISALIAHQQFATPGFGFAGGQGAAWGVAKNNVNQSVRESASGHGARLDYRTLIGSQFVLSWHAQSRVDMRAFESVRGIYAEAGDFDLPGRFGAQAEWRPTAVTALALGVERIRYGSVTPFTSNALPDRLLSLMADGHAPSFEWQDLTVYSVEGRLLDGVQGEWLMRFTSRQQPSATVDLYRRALESEYTDTNIMFGYRRGLRQFGEISFTASYAPSMAFLGAGPVFTSQTYQRGAVSEFEASWVVPF